MKRLYIITLILSFTLFLGNPSWCQAADTMMEADSVAVVPADSVAVVPSDSLAASKPGLFKRLITSLFSNSEDHTRQKKVDLSFVAYPSYSHEPGLGLGGALTALYRMDRNDSLPVPSDAFVSFNASLKGFFQIYGKGNNLFPNGRTRLNYVVELYRMPLSFWGITAEETSKNERSKYDRYMVDVQLNLMHQLLPGLYGGVRLRNNFTAATRVENPEYLLGEKHSFYVTGLGLILEYDTRDNLLNPSRGFHIAYRPSFFWKALGTQDASFWNHTFFADAYSRLWRDAIVGVDLYGSFNSHQVPWTMREQVASDGIRQRGYYMGSTMDNDQIAAQVELRQHIYKRLGITLWGGCATIFNEFSDFRRGGKSPSWLPNYGVGIRFELKKNANIRLDCGFAKNDFGIIFAFGEAF